jgi:LmbE family N-acetylglucosaminyl deacetylase
VALPLTILITATCVYYAELHMSARALATETIPELPRIQRTDRILVIAPHPDDEVLGCGGLIQRALSSGAQVWVIVVTDGEAFGQSVAIEERTFRPGTTDLRRYARQRQSETLAGTEALGLPTDHVIFLNFPDRAMSELWRRNWDRPRWSPLEGADGRFPPGLVPSASLTGDGLTSALLQELEKIKPTRVFATHPLDDHADHALTSTFLGVALLRYQAVTHLDPQLTWYVIHRGDWPIPQGYAPSSTLTPPPGFYELGPLRLDLQPNEEQRKSAALSKYGSQLRLLGRFLWSFVRHREMFYESSARPDIHKREIRLGDAQDNWAGLAPLADEPVGDTFFRQVSAGLDIAGLYGTADDSRLSLRFDFVGRVSRAADYRLVVRGFDASGNSVGCYDESLVPRRGHRGQYVFWRGNTLEWQVRRSEFPGATTVVIQLETHLFGLTYDRSAAIFAELPK